MKSVGTVVLFAVICGLKTVIWWMCIYRVMPFVSRCMGLAL